MTEQQKEKKKKIEKKKGKFLKKNPHVNTRNTQPYTWKKADIPGEQEINTEDREQGEREIGRLVTFMEKYNVIIKGKGGQAFSVKSPTVNLSACAGHGQLTVLLAVQSS